MAGYQSFFDNTGNELTFREVYDLCDRSYEDFTRRPDEPCTNEVKKVRTVMIAGQEMELEAVLGTPGSLSGFAAIVVRKPCSWRALVFRGSDDDQDWLINNVPGAVSVTPPPQYVEGLAQALFHRPSVIVGHSLGGGIATYAACMTWGCAATIFPAPLNPGWLPGNVLNVFHNVQNYVSPGEILSMLNLPPLRMRMGRDVWIETKSGSPKFKHLLPNVIVK